jgi:serine-type D-Ala-D-Ala carboxypeptidase/endopeptidase (penicillin-binding protein 4)
VRNAEALCLLLAVSGCAANPTPATRVTESPAVRELRNDLERVFNAPIMARGVWGVDVRSLATGERLYALNAGKLMMPASNMKIFTLAATAEQLGWDFRFTTTLETTGTVSGGVLHGDLIVRSNGDPTINSRDNRATKVLDEWAAALEQAGVHAIDGRIVGDDQAFDDETLGAGWSWDYLQYGYAAPVGALEYDEDIATLTVAAAATPGDPAIVRLSPGSGLSMLNRATTGPAESRETIDYVRHLDAPVLEITGSIPLGAAAAVRSVAVVNPTIYFAQSLKDGLSTRGIPVTGEPVDLDDVAASFIGAPDRRVLATTPSPPLRQIATVLMKASQNLYAETLLKTLGGAPASVGTARAGRLAVAATLTSWGVPEDAYVMLDGSGLSRYDYVTPEAVVTVLTHLYNDPRHRDAFVATLPIAGRDGTISTRLRRTRAEGNAVAKTGSIANARSLSGYVRSRDGEMLVFSIVGNDFVIPAASVNWIADLAVEILANFTRH